MQGAESPHGRQNDLDETSADDQEGAAMKSMTLKQLRDYAASHPHDEFNVQSPET